MAHTPVHEADELRLLACATGDEMACARVAIGLEEDRARADMPSDARSAMLSHLSEKISAAVTTVSTRSESSIACVPQFAWDGESAVGSSAASITFDLLKGECGVCFAPVASVGERCILGTRPTATRPTLGEPDRQQSAATDFVVSTPRCCSQHHPYDTPPNLLRAPLNRPLDLDSETSEHRTVSAHPAVWACSYSL